MNNVASPDNSDRGIEAQLSAKGFTAPRVTPACIKANILSDHYFTASDGVHGYYGGQIPPEHIVNDDALKLLTFCVLVLRNGFTVVGKSACASPENFDADIGRSIARADAEQQIWPLMGYALKLELHNAKQAKLAYQETGAAA